MSSVLTIKNNLQPWRVLVFDTRATALMRRRDKHTPLDQTRLKAEKKSDDGSGVAR